MVMSSNGSARSPKHNALSSTPKTAADVHFASTTSHGSATPSPNIRPSKEKPVDRKTEKHQSSGGKSRTRWSLRSRTSLLRVKQNRADHEDEQRPGSSSRLHSSHGVQEDGLQAQQKETSEQDGRSASSSGIVQSSIETKVDIEQDRHRTAASSSKTSSTYSPEPAKANGGVVRDDAMRTPELDPAQLVQMALNLSESRRRHSSLPGMLLSTPEVPPLRQSFVNSSSPRQQRKSPLQTSKLSEDSYRESPSSRTSDHVDTHPDKPVLSFPSSTYEPPIESFSPATLVRAERARKYFELADQHRRLLSILQANPAAARSASTNGASSATGTYNPLQALRNRRTRESSSPTLRINPETFQDVANVEDWIDEVETAVKKSPDKLEEDSSSMPHIANANYVQSANASSHKRTGTADTVVQRTGTAWSMTPAELLADAYAAIHDSPQAGGDPLEAFPTEAAGNGQTDSPNGKIRSSMPLQHVDSLNNNPEGVRRRFLPLKAADRLRGTRLTRLTRSASASSASSVEAANKSLFDPNMDSVNIGPLRRHMNHLIETQEQALPANGAPVSPDHWGLAKAHQFAARQRATSRAGVVQQPESSSRKGRRSFRGRASTVHERVPAEPSSGDASRVASPSKHPVSAKVATDDRHISGRRGTGQIANTDTIIHSPQPTRARSIQSFDDPAEDSHAAQPLQSSTTQYQDHAIDPSRLSVESARPSFFRRQRTADSITTSFFSRTQSGKDAEFVEPASAISRPRLKGRFVDMVRNEGAKIGDKVRNKDSKQRVPTSDVSTRNSDVSDVEISASARMKGRHGSGDDTATPLEQSMSKNRFHIPHLPSFRSTTTTTRDGQLLTPIMSGESEDHISRQQAALRLHNRSPRFERLAPPPIDSSGKWPRFQESKEGQQSTLSDQEVESMDKARRSLEYESGGPSTSDDKLLYDEKPRLTRDNLERHTKEYGTISSRDIARVRTLLIASGIKARALTQQLQSPSTEGSMLLTASARACNLDTRIVAQKARIDQAPHAARVLCAYLDDSVRATQEKVHAFQAQRLQPLITRQEMLKSRVSEDLAELVHSTADQADAFNVELSTQATLRTKQVDDAIDSVLRLRRRQFRLVRQALFKLLEWFVLALLWGVWFVVVCFNTLRRLITGIFRFLRWILTF